MQAQLTRSLPSKEEAPYLLVHMHGTQTLEMIIRCVSNIDEEVLYHACLALSMHAWIHAHPHVGRMLIHAPA